MRSHLRKAPLATAIALTAILAPWAGGCFGYVMGLSDYEVDRHRRVIAELEVKNAALVEEVLELRRRLAEIEARPRETGEADGVDVIDTTERNRDKQDGRDSRDRRRVP